MDKRTHEWQGQTPWDWLAEIADEVVREQFRTHAKSGDYLIHADRRDFAEAFELPCRIVIGQAVADQMKKYQEAESLIPRYRFGADAIAKQVEVNLMRERYRMLHGPDAK